MDLRFLNRPLIVLIALSLLLSASAHSAVVHAPTALRFEFSELANPAGNELILRGAGAVRQLNVCFLNANGGVSDATRQVTYSTMPEGIVSVDPAGRIAVLKDGLTLIEARDSTSGLSTTLKVRVEEAATNRPIHFVNQIVPIFTKASCNSGGCHGKSGGQNGFKLSLLGFEPEEDYEHLVREARGRRLFPAAPENSLLLLKGIGSSPHGGGKRLEQNSDDYRMVVRWIEQGMPFGSQNDPRVESIEVFPQARVMKLGGVQQLSVLARYTDGTLEDVTRSALFEPNEKSMASVDEEGFVTLSQLPGDVAVMVRYQGKSTTFRATLPLGAPVENLPQPRNEIDRAVFAKLTAMGMPPSPKCDDATFLRRASLDIAGRIPQPTEVTAFANDLSPNKRDALIDRLLESEEHAQYFAGKWSSLLRNKRTRAQDAPMNFAFHNWLVESFRTNKPYDVLVRELLSASGTPADNPPVSWFIQVKETQQQLEDAAQLFLGTRLQCAQCHHHPFEKWSQADYYRFSAFFSQLGKKGTSLIMHRRGTATALNKKTKQPVKPAALGTGEMEIPPDVDPRIVLSDWMRSPENPFFAKALVNRYWKHFLNRGIVEPEDDMRDTNPPSNPELLEVLARHFISSGFDQRSLIREIVRSETYQLSALPNEHNAADRQNFSRYYPKRLPAEVLYDAIGSVCKVNGTFPGLPQGTKAISLPDNSFNATSYFLTVFGRPESSSACECERSQDASLAQALHLINAKDIQDRIASDIGAAALYAGKWEETQASLQELYLTALSRQPSPAEIDLSMEHISKARKTPDGQPLEATKSRRQSFEDLIWTLLNTKEFLFNH